MKDPELLRRLHLEWQGDCVLADNSCVGIFSLHHVCKHPRDDVEENLVMLCGDGTTGHHGKIEAHDQETKVRLVLYLIWERSDFARYLIVKTGSQSRAYGWLEAYLRETA